MVIEDVSFLFRFMSDASQQVQMRSSKIGLTFALTLASLFFISVF
jgi:hypothetical protein